MSKLSASILSLLTLTLANCSQTATSPSGFLSNYDQLKPDPTRFDAALLYVDPAADFKKYDRLVIDTIILSGDRSGLSPKEEAGLAEYFRTALERELGKDYELVQTPGPSTMRFQAALAGMKPPTGSGLAAYVDSTNIEGEIVDSQTGKRLVALAGKSLEDFNPKDTLSSIDDVKKTLDTTAVRVRNGMKDLRARILTTN